MTKSFHISSRLRRAVGLHVIKNLLAEQLGLRTPLMMGVHGPSGEGKTFQVASVLEELGAESFPISGGELESPNAGAPAALIRTNYVRAGSCKNARFGVVLLNDVDTGIGGWTNTQYTINRQTVLGQLMHLSDYPTRVGEHTTPRIPIILTGNDLSSLYGPLLRAGRMSAFEWSPTAEERLRIVAGILPELEVSDCERLIDELTETTRSAGDDAPWKLPPIAFYAAVRDALTDSDLWETIERVGLREACEAACSGDGPEELAPRVTYPRVRDVAETLLKERLRIVNHVAARG